MSILGGMGHFVGDLDPYLTFVRGWLGRLVPFLPYFLIVDPSYHTFVMWFDAPESTYHTSFDFKVPVVIELALCLITKVGPVPACREPPM